MKNAFSSKKIVNFSHRKPTHPGDGVLPCCPPFEKGLEELT